MVMELPKNKEKKNKKKITIDTNSEKIDNFQQIFFFVNVKVK